MTTLTDAILDCFGPHDCFVAEDGSSFQALFESELMSRLRERGWKLPPAGFFMSEVERAGFTVKQGYQMPAIKRLYCDGSKGRSVSKYQTLVSL